MPVEAGEAASEGVRKIRERLAGLDTDEGRLKAFQFKPRADDVFIVTPPKAGTTWMQQICHGLRTGGSMDFDEISLVIPHIELAHDSGITDLDAEQVALPRMYKTHFWYDHTPKGARYIYVVRDPLDMSLSFYHFFKGWFFEPGEVSLREFTEGIVLNRGRPDHIMQNASFWHNIASWWPHRMDPNVLWLHYEDMKQDLSACVQLIAEFIGRGAGDDDLRKLVVEQASMEFMKKHASKFDEHHLKLARNEAAGLPREAGMGANNPGKVRDGRVGEHKESLPEDICQKMAKKWKAVLEPLTGYTSYEEMRVGNNKELNRPFK